MNEALEENIIPLSSLSLRNCRVVVTIIARDEEKENKSFFLEKREARLNLRWKEGEKSWTRFEEFKGKKEE